jgi:hypothetical protein
MAEFVNGYEAMGRIGPCVSILVQHERSQKTSNTYLQYKATSALFNAAGTSGLNIVLPFEQHFNPH